jgi:glycosyltransferase involved in cell wall biosynthesis
MRVLNVVSLGYSAGGAETHVRELSNVLRARGHVVAAFASDIGPSDGRFDDYTFARVPERGFGKLVGTVYNRAARRSLREALDAFEPDVVVLHTLQQVTPAPLFELAHVPTVMLVHGPEIYTRQLLIWSLASGDFRTFDIRRLSNLTAAGMAHYAFYRAICDPLYRIAFRRVDEIVTFSAYMRDLLRKEGLAATYIPLGVTLFDPAPLPADLASILYVGRIEWNKGVFTLLDAFAGVLRSHPNARLVLAGEGAHLDRLKSEARRQGIDGSMEYLGRVGRTDLQAVYASCGIVVIPSIFVEAFGKVGPEALSVGRPVIASDSGGIREWLQPGLNGLLVRPGDARSLESSLLSLMENTTELERLSGNAAGSVAHLSIERHADQFEALLERVARHLRPGHESAP